MVHGRDLKFHMCIPHEKKVDPYFFMSFLSYVCLKTKFENLFCKVSQKVFIREPSYLVNTYWD